MPTICCLIILLLGMRQALHHFRSTCHSVSQRLKNYDVASSAFRQYSIFSFGTLVWRRNYRSTTTLCDEEFFILSVIVSAVGTGTSGIGDKMANSDFSTTRINMCLLSICRTTFLPVLNFKILKTYNIDVNLSHNGGDIDTLRVLWMTLTTPVNTHIL